MYTCTSCNRSCSAVRTGHKRWCDKSKSLVDVVGPDEKLCHKCARKRGSLPLADILRGLVS